MNQHSRTLDDVLAKAMRKPALRVAVAHPVTEVVLNAVAQAQDAGLGQAQALVKGSLHTDELLHAALANPKVRGELRLSHSYVLQHPAYPKAFMLTDAAINIAPDLRVKSEIV